MTEEYPNSTGMHAIQDLSGNSHSESLDSSHIPIHLLLGDWKSSSQCLESSVTHDIITMVKSSLELSFNSLNLLDSISSSGVCILEKK